MKLMVAHLKQIPRFRLLGGAGENPPSYDEEELQTSTANEVDRSLEFYSDGEDIIDDIVKSQELEFDSDAEDHIEFLTMLPMMKTQTLIVKVKRSC